MKKSKFTETQIIKAIKEHEAGRKAEDICRELGISTVSFYKWKHADKTGREDRINFGGIHKVGIRHETTKLEMELLGFDIESGKIRNTNGRIILTDKKGE